MQAAKMIEEALGGLKVEKMKVTTSIKSLERALKSVRKIEPIERRKRGPYKKRTKKVHAEHE